MNSDEISSAAPAAAAAGECNNPIQHVWKRAIHATDDGNDADDEGNDKSPPSAPDHEDEEDGKKRFEGVGEFGQPASVPGTPELVRAQRWTLEFERDCTSETEARSGGRRRRRLIRERDMERSWDRKWLRARDSVAASSGGLEGAECMVVVRPGGGSGRRICMDMEEVRACRDLGLAIPRDFTVEILGGLSGNSSGADSPSSTAGEDAKEMKAKLKMWARAVAFLSAAARSRR
ncbi:hypothetical protein HPP92_012361 [Vanilla planifolia]|uniref:Uncharacterized protein n=1 Tax=Vanilla planifolia TaxID=51239 RepID=A0A835R1E5_VANPL|nr:hypothetical protein HPP92_012361 [Vanilla planifolia]